MQNEQIAVHLALCELHACGPDGNRLTWLSKPEQARLATFGAALRRRQFIAGHWLLRRLLAHAFGGVPADWQLSDARDAAPLVLSGPSAVGDVSRFKVALSHSGRWVAAAFADVAIGIDVEDGSRRQIDAVSLAPEVLHPVEWQALRAQPATDWPLLLRQRWSIKEAWLKAHGEGVGPSRLQQLQTEPASASTANAQLWSGADWCLALALPTCTADRVDVRLDLDHAIDAAAQSTWQLHDQASSMI